MRKTDQKILDKPKSNKSASKANSNNRNKKQKLQSDKNAQNFADMIRDIKDSFSGVQEFNARSFSDSKVQLFYISGLCDEQALGLLIVEPVQHCISQNKIKSIDKVVSTAIFEEIADVNTIKDEITSGKAILAVNNKFYNCGLDKTVDRAISEPPTSAVIQGPRTGFVENIKVNVSQIRRLVKSDHLKSENIEIGEVTKTRVNIMYIENIIDKKVLKEVKKRINSIKVDGIVDSSFVAQMLEPRPTSMFKQVGLSEKPDVVVAKLLEGRIAILVDGSPFVLTVPFVLIEDLQNSDDYYTLHFRASFLRVVRLLSIIVTVYATGLYLAVQLHHYKAIPLKFLITIINATQNLPLTPLGEMLFVLLLFEVLYEASLRMPKHLGLALSIVGALILGDTAVKSGLISPPAVMIVAISGMSMYTIPEQHAQMGLIRLVFTLVGAFLGFYGIILTTIFFVAYLCDFDNYGSPYLAPLAPRIQNDLKDGVMKNDFVYMSTRPKSFPNKNRIRIKRAEGKDAQN